MWKYHEKGTLGVFRTQVIRLCIIFELLKGFVIDHATSKKPKSGTVFRLEKDALKNLFTW